MSYVVLHHQTSSSPCLASASYCCAAISSFSRPAHLLTTLQYLCLAGTSSLPCRHLSWLAHPHCRAALSYFCRCIQSPRPHCLSWLAHPIAYFGQCIPLPRQTIIFQPAHPIAAPPLPILAGASHRLFWPVHPIAAPPYHILAGASLHHPIIFGWRCHAALSYFGRRIQ